MYAYIAFICSYVSIHIQIAVEALTQISSAVPASLWCRTVAVAFTAMTCCDPVNAHQLLRVLHKGFFSGRCSAAGPKQIEDIESELDPGECSIKN